MPGIDHDLFVALLHAVSQLSDAPIVFGLQVALAQRQHLFGPMTMDVPGPPLIDRAVAAISGSDHNQDRLGSSHAGLRWHRLDAVRSPGRMRLGHVKQDISSFVTHPG
jgi:hypothetical protein